ncbi:MAG: ABC transporter permease [Cumulibacter sp.]
MSPRRRQVSPPCPPIWPVTARPAYCAGCRPLRCALPVFCWLRSSSISAGVVVGSLLALIAGVLVFDSPMPEAPLLSLLVFVLAVASMFGFGLLIGGLANKATTAQGIGMLLYFPMLFSAGLWTPGPAMPETLQTISTYTPLSAASQAMSDAWYGGDFPALQLVVVTAWAVVLFLAAARFFRWK